MSFFTIFFYEHNRRKLGGAEKTWKTKVHMEHSSPFASYDQLDGLKPSGNVGILSSITNLSTEHLSPAIVQNYQETLNTVKNK
jgi:hypothetical protein